MADEINDTASIPCRRERERGRCTGTDENGGKREDDCKMAGRLKDNWREEKQKFGAKQT